MTRWITGKEPDPCVVYADIIDHPHWQSPTRPHMSLHDRAAQFAPFAALSGYDDMVREEARVVENKIEPGEAGLEELNQKLNLIRDSIRDGIRPTVSITYFVPDSRKAGGKYVTAIEEIRKIDALRGTVVLTRTEGCARRNAEIPIQNILEIREATGNSPGSPL